MKPSIEKIVFNVRGKKIELSQDEAKELKNILSDLFNEKQVVHEWHTWPYHWWNNPYPHITYASGNLSSTFTGTISNSPCATTDTLYLTVA